MLKIRTDHLLHGLASFALAMVVTAVLSAFAAPLPLVWGALAALAVGIGKEAFDYLSKKGTPEFSDIIADLAGILGAVICAILLLL